MSTRKAVGLFVSIVSGVALGSVAGAVMDPLTVGTGILAGTVGAVTVFALHDALRGGNRR